jgi:hypothetical protein
VAGVAPDPFTLRELVWMAQGRREHDWTIASSQMALLANCHRDPKKRGYTPDDFNPLRGRRGGIPMTKHNLGAIARALSAQAVTIKAADVRTA